MVEKVCDIPTDYWLQYCSSIDIISTFVDSIREFNDDKSYFQVTAVMQILYPFQDVMLFLAKMFNIDYTHNQEFREFRNSYFGHPIDRYKKYESHSINLLTKSISCSYRNTNAHNVKYMQPIFGFIITILTQGDVLLGDISTTLKSQINV